jgi:hypothetical protein
MTRTAYPPFIHLFRIIAKPWNFRDVGAYIGRPHQELAVARSGRQKVFTMIHPTLRPRFLVDSTPQLRVRRADAENEMLSGDVTNRAALIRVR